jgi:hypothetical protein
MEVVVAGVGEPLLVCGVRPLQRSAGEVRRRAASIPARFSRWWSRFGLAVGPGEGGRGRVGVGSPPIKEENVLASDGKLPRDAHAQHAGTDDDDQPLGRRS